jgi:hypothetical protein
VSKAQGRNTPERAQKASVHRLDRAFAKSSGQKNNLVSLHELRQHLGGTRESQDKHIRAGRVAKKYGLDTHEGLTRPPTAAQKAATIHESGSRFVYIAKR